ncbi:MAG: hypothetical protein AAB691_01105 [Patescibacteria group bacterium]
MTKLLERVLFVVPFLMIAISVWSGRGFEETIKTELFLSGISLFFVLFLSSLGTTPTARSRGGLFPDSGLLDKTPWQVVGMILFTMRWFIAAQGVLVVGLVIYWCLAEPQSFEIRH